MSTAMPVLESERLLIRPPESHDLGAIHRIFVDAGWDENTPTGLDERRQWLEWVTRNHQALANLYQPPYGDRVIQHKADSICIGMVGIVPTLNRWGVLPYYRDGLNVDDRFSFPEVGLFWALAAQYQGQGYATEAARTLVDYLFTQLQLARVIAQTDTDNVASQQVMLRLGMTLNHNPKQNTMPWLQTVGILENTNIQLRNPDSE